MPGSDREGAASGDGRTRSMRPVRAHSAVLSKPGRDASSPVSPYAVTERVDQPRVQRREVLVAHAAGAARVERRRSSTNTSARAHEAVQHGAAVLGARSMATPRLLRLSTIHGKLYGAPDRRRRKEFR